MVQAFVVLFDGSELISGCVSLVEDDPLDSPILCVHALKF